MHDFITGLNQRREEIVERVKTLEKYMQEIQQLKKELQHIDALLYMHTTSDGYQENLFRRSFYSDFIYNSSKKLPSGIARHIMSVFVENDMPLPIYEIDKQLRTRDIEVSTSGINTALRRNAEYFEQVEKGKWQLKKSHIPVSETRETEPHGQKMAQPEPVEVG